MFDIKLLGELLQIVPDCSRSPEVIRVAQLAGDSHYAVFDVGADQELDGGVSLIPIMRVLVMDVHGIEKSEQGVDIEEEAVHTGSSSRSSRMISGVTL